MSMERINLRDRNFWKGWVSTVEAEAGEALGLKNRNERVFKERCQSDIISIDYRPTVYPFVFQKHQRRNWDLFRSSPSTTVINNHNAPTSRAIPQTEEEKDAAEKQKQANTAKVIGSLFAIAGAFLVGFVPKKWEAQWEATKDTEAVQEALKSQIKDRSLSRQFIFAQKKLEEIVFCQLRIDTLKSQKITGYFRATIGLFVGSLVWAGGRFAVSPAFMTMGKVTLLFSAIIAAGNCGLHWGDEKTIETLRYRIVVDSTSPTEGLARWILTCIWNSAEEGTSVSPNSETEEYVPLYPDEKEMSLYT